MVNCKLCGKELKNTNKSGFCYKCYTKSPRFRKYQRDYQRKVWYRYHKNKKKEYAERNKDWIKEYQKIYQKANIEKTRIKKREWARKNRKINKERVVKYQIEYKNKSGKSKRKLVIQQEYKKRLKKWIKMMDENI